MRVTTKGQVTIPIEIRKRLNLKPGMEVAFIIDDEGNVTLVKKEERDDKSRFARQRGVATVEMSTEEIMALTRPDA